MSILIKGVKMPKSCGDCPCQQEEYGYCQVIEEEARFCDYTSRPEWCPLVALPEHHGRLIDADALYKRLLKQQDGHEEELAIGDYVFRSIIAAAPTVIEEE